MFDKFMQKFVHFLDPKLQRFRPQKEPVKTPPFTPQTLAEFIAVLKRTPKSILSSEDRARISAIMSFGDRHVSDLTTPKSQIIFVSESEVLGPLTLDKLYKSGFTHFPVIDSHKSVKGILHTEALNALEIKNTDRASKYLDPIVHYLRASDSLDTAVSEIIRTGDCFFLVRDDNDTLIGFFTVEILLNYLLGKS